MLLAKILPNKFAASLEHDRVVPLARIERAVPFMAFPRTSLDGEFLHAFACSEIRKRNLDQEISQPLSLSGALFMNYLGLFVVLIDYRTRCTLPSRSEGRHCRSSLRDDCVHNSVILEGQEDNMKHSAHRFASKSKSRASLPKPARNWTRFANVFFVWFVYFVVLFDHEQSRSRQERPTRLSSATRVAHLGQAAPPFAPFQWH